MKARIWRTTVLIVVFAASPASTQRDANAQRLFEEFRQLRPTLRWRFAASRSGPYTR